MGEKKTGEWVFHGPQHPSVKKELSNVFDYLFGCITKTQMLIIQHEIRGKSQENILSNKTREDASVTINIWSAKPEILTKQCLPTN